MKKKLSSRKRQKNQMKIVKNKYEDDGVLVFKSFSSTIDGVLTAFFCNYGIKKYNQMVYVLIILLQINTGGRGFLDNRIVSLMECKIDQEQKESCSKN